MPIISSLDHEWVRRSVATLFVEIELCGARSTTGARIVAS